MPTQRSLQFTEAMDQQVKALGRFGTRTDIVRIALDRLYREEITIMSSDYRVTVGTYTPKTPGKLSFREAARVAAALAGREAARGAEGEMLTVWDGTVEAVTFYPVTGKVSVTQEMNTNGEWDYIAAAIRNHLERSGDL